LRQATAEGVGTGLLVTVVVGSGIAAQRLSPGNTGLQLLENSIATGAGLVVLILMFLPVSGAHLNPVVSLAQRTLGAATTAKTLVFTGAQITGACAGAMLANLMFDLPPVTLSTDTRSSAALWLSEFVATFGLVLVILALVRADQRVMIPFAVGAYIAAAYWFTSSTSFANPAVTIGRMLTDTFSGIAPSSVPMFVGAQITGGLTAVLAARYWYPAVEPE
jgi:arsenate reductase